MVSITDIRCRRLMALVESAWHGTTAEIFIATEDKIVFRIRTVKGRYRTPKITLLNRQSIDRDWLCRVVYESIVGE